METIVKTEKPKKNKVKEEPVKMIPNNLHGLYGLCKGMISYESDEIFKAYRYQCQ